MSKTNKRSKYARLTPTVRGMFQLAFARERRVLRVVDYDRPELLALVEHSRTILDLAEALACPRPSRSVRRSSASALLSDVAARDPEMIDAVSLVLEQAGVA